MIHETGDWVFSHLCHQVLVRSWAPAGHQLAVCERCVGVYAGAALWLLLVPLLPRPTKTLYAVHGAFLVQMAVLGTHTIPHGASIRTLSGQLFIIGVLFLLWHHVRPVKRERKAWPYLAGVAATAVLLQAAVRIPSRLAATGLDALALAGLAVIAGVAALSLALLAVRLVRRA